MPPAASVAEEGINDHLLDKPTGRSGHRIATLYIVNQEAALPKE